MGVCVCLSMTRVYSHELCMYTVTMVTEVVHQHDLMKQLLGRAVDHTNDGT